MDTHNLQKLPCVYCESGPALTEGAIYIHISELWSRLLIYSLVALLIRPYIVPM